MIRRPPRSTHCISSAASDVYKRQFAGLETGGEGEEFGEAGVLGLVLVSHQLHISRLLIAHQNSGLVRYEDFLEDVAVFVVEQAVGVASPGAGAYSNPTVIPKANSWVILGGLFIECLFKFNFS
eukprot:TRINITY_DN4934_c0_g1_i17.p1 TRINITY_DN4934_c0_g1~~TRINITY_DN4934_c0_g1_i17.p1  ORF type:complete len:132 (+),score=31.57 TRINITY_DN4934_c0_g1_i17:25-396(+)